MNSIHKAGVAIAALVTIVAVAGAFVVQGYVAARQAQEAAAAPGVADVAVATDTPPPAPTATPTLPPQVVYIAPVPTPAVITVTPPPKPARKAASTTPDPTAQVTPPVIHVIVSPPPGEHEDGEEGDD
jgi:hypothetical protein